MHTAIYLYIPPYTYTYHYIPIYTTIYLYIPLYTYTYHYIPIYTAIYLHIPLYTYAYCYIPTCTAIYLCIPPYTYIYCYILTHTPIYLYIYRHIPIHTAIYLYIHCYIPTVQFSSVAQSCPTLCDPMNHSVPGLPVHQKLPEFIQTHAHRAGDAIQPSHPLSPPSPPSPNPPASGSFPMNPTLHIMWPKYWSFSFSISPSSEHPGLISFRMDWLDLFALQGTLKTLLQHHSSKASILWCSAFFTVQLSHPYMTTEKTIVLTRWTFVGKVMSLLFNMLSRLVTNFLPRSKHL